MNSPTRYLPILAGTLAMIGLAGTAHAAIEVNIGGSSAGTNFATDVPLNLCDAGVEVPVNTLPNRYSSTNGKLITWVCQRAGADIIIRYAATSSVDGILKVSQPANQAASNMSFLDHTLTTGCTGPTVVTRASDSKKYNNTVNCANGNTTSLPAHMGASDVSGPSFHQNVGGVNVTPQTNPPRSVQTAIVPFSLFVGKGVVKNVAGAPGGQISGLSRMEIEAIFNRQAQAKDWKAFGFGTVTDADTSTLEATSPIHLCGRQGGSGTLAAFDETIMINATHTSGVIPDPEVQLLPGSADVLDCIATNRRSIGYMDADQLVKFQTGGSKDGLGYVIRIDGGLANDVALTDKKRDLKCGKYAYWAGWRLNRRAAGADGIDIDALTQAFIDNAGAQGTIAIIPTGAFWAADEDMFVSKNSDRGPLVWKSGDHSACK